jgi:hypothetical protein
VVDLGLALLLYLAKYFLLIEKETGTRFGKQFLALEDFFLLLFYCFLKNFSSFKPDTKNFVNGFFF